MNPLLEFSVSNYRSINDMCTLSLIADITKESPLSNIVEIGDNRVLKTAVVYGANSSGKSNLLNAIYHMKYIVLSSVKKNNNDKLEYNPFLFSTEKNRPSFFEITFLLDESKYRYGFEISQDQVLEEWLMYSELNRKKEKKLFYRNSDDIKYDSKLFPEGKGKSEMINDNRLFLSLCAQLGGDTSKLIISWFQNNINVISGISSDGYLGISKIMLHENRFGSEDIKAFLSKMQLGFEDIDTIENDLQFPVEVQVAGNDAKQVLGAKTIDIISNHNVYNINGDVVDKISMPFDAIESEGTKKLFDLSGPIFDTLNNGRVLIIDELDAKMHPHISWHIINLFNSPETNKSGAQLIISTHDTHLLSSKLFRRDQIWFTEKDAKEQTDLYNMLDIVLPDGSKPRNDANYERNYIAGRYGAVPYIIND
ncbi:MAG: ATP-binding protein [bacterium]